MKFTKLTLIVAALVALTSCESKVVLEQNQPVAFSQVKITDNFWQPRLKTHAEVTLQACLNQCEFETGRVDNFAVAAGMQEGEFRGVFYDDSDLYKALEGAAYSLMNNPNAEVEARVDSIIEKIAGAQREDGYLNTYYTLGDYDKRWTDMNMHEMYCGGHLIEAAIAYYNATGKDKLLNVAKRFADHMYDMWGTGDNHWVPGHEEIELALVKLYRITGEKKYLNFAHRLLEERGQGRGTWDAWNHSVLNRDYYQDNVPVKDLESIHGHSVRAMYLFTGMADYSSAASDTTYLAALDRLWDDVVLTRMYITGGIGSSASNEGFTVPYDLPNESAYCETCASVGMVMWNQRMNMFKGDARYADVVERSMYNGALAGVSISGDRFFYVNPLYSAGKHHRRAWYGTACCPSQISRFLPSIGGYVYAQSENAIWVNLFVGSQSEIKVGKQTVALDMQTNYPWEGATLLTVTPEKEGEQFAIRFRLPEWCRSYTLTVNGEAYEAANDRGYLVVDRVWNAGDKVAYNMDMPVEVVKADDRVLANVGRRAIQRGPLVYCIEEVDNKKFDKVELTPETTYSTQFEADLLGGIQTITAQSGKQTIKFIPYYAWDNREAGKMEVWVKYNE